MSERIWYFAYGSNMQPATFRGRRGIVPLDAVPARLAGWRLVLDKPPLIPLGESMANVVEDAAAEVLGVAYAVSRVDLEHIDLTEGVFIDNYRRVSVRVMPLDGRPDALEAFTLTSERRDARLRPSRRYMALLVEGAEHHGLPAAYVEWLRAIPAVEETPEATEARALLDRSFRAMKKEPR